MTTVALDSRQSFLDRCLAIAERQGIEDGQSISAHFHTDALANTSTLSNSSSTPPDTRILSNIGAPSNTSTPSNTTTLSNTRKRPDSGKLSNAGSPRDKNEFSQAPGAHASNPATIPSERATAGIAAPIDPRPMLIVPGLLGDNLSSLVAPFMCARRSLAVKDRPVRVAWLNGRAGCTRNAARLRTVVLEEADKAGTAIDLVGYSKGCTDALHMLGDWPDTHAALRSLTSLGGVVAGTPLAGSAPPVIAWLLSRTPLPVLEGGFGQGDGRAIADLKPTFRHAWLASHELPDSIRYLSIVARPEPGRVSRVLRHSWRALARTDAANDSQVIARDAVIPNSELLAIVNADHWAIALPIAEQSRLLARFLVTENDFPRDILLEALMDHLAAMPDKAF